MSVYTSPRFNGDGRQWSEPSSRIVQMMLAHMSEAPPSACALRPELPAAFDALLQRCLAKRPEDRYANAQALAQALRTAAA